MISYRQMRRALCAAIVLIPFAVGAQTPAEDPQNPQAAISSAPYKSVFSDYKSYQDPALQPWRKSNADVSQTDTMTDSGMGNMKGMTEKNMAGMKGKSTTAPEKKPTSPSGRAPGQNGSQKQ